MEDFWVNIGQVLAPIAIYGVGVWSKILLDKIKSKRKHSLSKEAPKTDMRITTALQQTLDKIGAMRVYYTKYHNGQYFDDESPIQKQSRTHEVVRPGADYQSQNFKDMLISTIPYETKIVLEPGASWQLVNTIKLGRFRWLCEHAGATAIARCGVFKGKNLVGFIGADFDGANGIKAPANIEELCRLAEDVQHLLVDLQ